MLSTYLENYQNTEEHNNYLWESFREKVDENLYLKKHRDYVEKHKAGFGDRSFHYMWYLLLKHLQKENEIVRCLEIGVFKGQTISLWQLIAKELDFKIDITGVTPLEGNYPNNKIYRNYKLRKLLSLFSAKLRKDFKEGNIHVKEDFLSHINEMFKNSNLNMEDIKFIKGYSNEKNTLEKVKDLQLNLVYIDGDHSYKVCLEDIQNYGPLIKKGGFMIIDDAANFIPGSKFFKGILEVSKATEEIDKSVFKNVLNVGHNRVFQKIA